jgi:hypothetical protein
MNMLGGIFKALVNPASLMQLAMGPAGWASLAMKTIGSQIAMSLIEQIGQKIGLPPSMINLAQAAFGAASGQPGLAQQNIKEAVGDFVKELNLRPSEAGQLERELTSATDKSMNSMMDIASKYKKKSGGADGEEEGGSWLVALAKAMGKHLDAKAAQIKEKSDAIAAAAKPLEPGQKAVDPNSAEGKQEQKELMSNNTLLQAYSQEMSILSNAVTNAIKSIGESQTTIARK